MCGVGAFQVRRRSLSSHRAARARASHLTGRVALLSWLCAFVRVQVIRSRGAWLGQLPPAMAGAAMTLGACAAALLARHLACGCLSLLALRLLRLWPF